MIDIYHKTGERSFPVTAGSNCVFKIYHLFALLCLLLMAAGITTNAQISTDALQSAPPTEELLTEVQTMERVLAAIDRGLGYIAGKQENNGSWATLNAPNALALLAFMGRGHVPGRGPYKEVIENGKRYILSTQRKDGFFIAGGSMYNHGLATLAMAEMYGMDPDPKVEDSLRKAIDLIIRAQSPAGGWRYSPNPGDQDMSVSVMQIVALRAASNAEIPVPAETIRKAIAFVHSCSQPSGAICYTPGSDCGPQTTAGGLLSLQLLGKYDDPQIPITVDYLSNVSVAWPGGAGYFFYFHYYAIQAFYHAGGKHWNRWHPKVRELLLSHQKTDGSWESPTGSETQGKTVGPNRIYATAMACLVLEVYLHFLPVYQK